MTDTSDELLALLNWQVICKGLGKKSRLDVSPKADRVTVTRRDKVTLVAVPKPYEWPHLPENVIERLRRADTASAPFCRPDRHNPPDPFVMTKFQAKIMKELHKTALTKSSWLRS